MRDEFDGFPVAVAERRAAPAADNASRAPARELAQRRSGDIDVFLLWHPGLDRIELCVLYLVTGVSVHVEVAPEKALDAFNHPHVYVTQRKPGPRQETDSEPARWE
jgi:hypothetical protein